MTMLYVPVAAAAACDAAGPCLYGLAVLGHTGLKPLILVGWETLLPLCYAALARNTVNDDDADYYV
jgi:hypothetical protein